MALQVSQVLQDHKGILDLPVLQVLLDHRGFLESTAGIIIITELMIQMRIEMVMEYLMLWIVMDLLDSQEYLVLKV